MNRLLSIVLWSTVALAAAVAFGVLALHRGETVSAAWILVAALCTYAIGYRFYQRFIARNIFALDDGNETPAVRHNDGQDFVPTPKWVVFGHHFAAIAGAGPLVGPILAAQFGYLPGTLWLIIGVVLAGAVQDFVILCASVRRDGKSLGQMAKEEVGPLAGWVALTAVLAILIILVAVLAMVVVKALGHSPWGTVTIALTILIAVLMGFWMRIIRPGKVLEASVIGVVLLGVALWLGKVVNGNPVWAHALSFTELQLAWAIIVYGFAAAVLPVWVLLAPRDYLSAFVKIGTIFLLAAGIFVVLPAIRMPALTSSVASFAPGGPLGDGKGPVFAGTLFPFAFITIACGAISGFHALVASGTTPKLVSKESELPMIGYGSMLMESFVAIMALIAACALSPGIYFVINSPEALISNQVPTAAATVSSWGFSVSAKEITELTASLGEGSILSRTGGAPTLAVGMAAIFSSVTKAFGGEGATAFWYHFAIMFEALFILTTVDAGTRIGRFLFQDLAGNLWKPLGAYNRWWAAWLASLAVVAGWGYFLVVGVLDKDGGIYVLWPLFGIANQVLAALALCVGTVVIVRMKKERWALLTIAPLLWLVAVTESAGYQKLFSTSEQVSFLARAHALSMKLLAGPSEATAVVLRRQLWNARLDAALCALFMLVILVILADATRRCVQLLRERRSEGM